jgi:hypothetical protein
MLTLAYRRNPGQILLVHLEVLCNLGYDDYRDIADRFEEIGFACDGIRIMV